MFVRDKLRNCLTIFYGICLLCVIWSKLKDRIVFISQYNPLDPIAFDKTTSVGSASIMLISLVC